MHAAAWVTASPTAPIRAMAAVAAAVVAVGEATSRLCATIVAVKATLRETASSPQRVVDVTVTEDGIIATIMSAVTTVEMTVEMTGETTEEEIDIGGDKNRISFDSNQDNHAIVKLDKKAEWIKSSEESSRTCLT